LDALRGGSDGQQSHRPRHGGRSRYGEHLVYVRGKGVLVDEPSVVAMNEQTHEILAVGHEAKRMIGRTPDGITAIRPLKDGVIADLDATEEMLRHFIQQVHKRRYFAKPRMIICVPSGVTAVEQRAVKEAGYQAGGRRVYIIEEPMAAAIGAGLPVHEATATWSSTSAVAPPRWPSSRSAAW
jgi:rod shape-determining protein MreB